MERDYIILGGKERAGHDLDPVALSYAARARHLYGIGITGTGKTTLIESLIAQDIQNGQGVCLIDPHGQIAERLIRYVPPHRLADFIYFDPADPEHVIPLNLVADQPKEHRDTALDAIVNAMHIAWADSWGANMDYILRNVIATLIEYPNTTLLQAKRLLLDPAYRDRVCAETHDPMLLHFWYKEYPILKADRSVGAILNKVGQLFLSYPMRNVFAAQGRGLDLRAVMDERKILIVNLSHGRIGIDNAKLLGSLFVSLITQAALTRAGSLNDEEEGREAPPTCYLYLDEFQLFTDPTSAGRNAQSDAERIISEARKFGLSLAIFHQFLDQIESRTLREAILANIKNRIVFTVGRKDADRLAEEFGTWLNADDLATTPTFRARFSSPHVDMPTGYLDLHTLPPFCDTFEHEPQAILDQHKRYAQPVAQIERDTRNQTLACVARKPKKAKISSERTVTKVEKKQARPLRSAIDIGAALPSARSLAPPETGSERGHR
jgi:hypothetical protein